MAGRPQPGIRDAYTPASVGTAWSPLYGNVQLTAAQRAAMTKGTKENKAIQRGAKQAQKDVSGFIGNEMLGVDDFSWAVKNARQGNWWEAAKSLGAGAIELGTTVVAPTAGAFRKQVGKVAAGSIKAREAENIVKAAAKAEKARDKAVAINKRRIATPAQNAEDLYQSLNPFKRQQLGKGKYGKGKGTGEGSGAGEGAGTGRGTGSGTGTGPGSGGAGGTKELITVGAKPDGVTRYADDFREPLSRPVQPKNNKTIQPGGSPSGEATQEAVEQTLTSELENLRPGMTLPKGKLAPAGILGMGLGAQSGMQSGTTSQVTPSSSTQTSTDVPLQTRTGLDSNPTGRPGGGGGGGRRPYDIPGAGASGVDVTIPYTY